ncbi:dual adapter for phosphotyrosine and 3-phosphotyrosine and 3-phosphoinositide [Anaeramoeba flamelloides]|uniref:Dual adapter for phosphotyrosine and 3-phosphotyrosine and 3-phosphoinositide n=1 Tax=Anaeramoeba flamelloides TaxID=1746091 RepID=A0ABQ8XE11_9EUKA|nr:dual adapter for phosphotyrosine and 3-phosphotyrosine and 3-phosphoinositide [Anaeramoeba flamelloides]
MNISDFSGYLTKRGKRVTNWKYRFFHLTNKKCAYYKNEEKFKKNAGKPKGVINLNNDTSVGIAAFEENKEKPHSFYIKTPERTYLIFARNKEQLTKWLNNLTLHISHPIQEKLKFLTQFPCPFISYEKKWSPKSENVCYLFTNSFPYNNSHKNKKQISLCLFFIQYRKNFFNSFSQTGLWQQVEKRKRSSNQLKNENSALSLALRSWDVKIKAVFSNLILTGIPKDVDAETITDYLSSSDILGKKPVYKLIYQTRNNQWIVVKCKTISKCIKFKEWTKANPLELNNVLISTPAIIPRCRYKDIQKIENSKKKKNTSNGIDIYLILHRTSTIMKFTADSNNNVINEGYIKQHLGIGNVKLLNITEGYSNLEENDRIYSVIEYGYYPFNLKFFVVNIHILSINKMININLETSLNIPINTQKKESIKKQDSNGSRFDIENKILSSENKPQVNHVIKIVLSDLEDSNSINQKKSYLLVGNEFLKNSDQLPLQNNDFNCFLILKSKNN